MEKSIRTVDTITSTADKYVLRRPAYNVEQLYMHSNVYAGFVRDADLTWVLFESDSRS